MTSSTPSYFMPLFLLFLAVAVESRPSPKWDDAQVLHSLFGSRLSSLIMATPTSDDITGGSPGHHSSSLSPSRELAISHGAARGLASRREVVPQFFLDFLRRQSKIKRRSRKSMVGGRGCFGMKMDRIGSISGLGC